MVFCPDCIITEYAKPCICKQGNICAYMRRCTDKMKWIPLDGMDKCKLRSDNQHGNVRMVYEGYLYIDVDDTTIKIKNPYNYEPTNVDLIKDENGEYIIKKG